MRWRNLETTNGGDELGLGWRETGRCCRRTPWRWQEEGRRRWGRRSRRETTGKSNEDASSYPRRCRTMPWSNLHQGWTSTIHWRRRRQRRQRRPRGRTIHPRSTPLNGPNYTRLNNYLVIDLANFSISNPVRDWINYKRCLFLIPKFQKNAH